MQLGKETLIGLVTLTLIGTTSQIEMQLGTTAEIC
jgi:hypothetical protein